MSSMDRLHVVVQTSYEIHFNINKNYILPKCSTLIVLRYVEKEKDESDLKNGPVQVPEEVKNGPVEVKNGPVQRNLHNFLVTKATKVHEDLLQSSSSLLSSSQQSVVIECWYNLPSKTVPIYNISCWLAYMLVQLAK